MFVTPVHLPPGEFVSRPSLHDSRMLAHQEPIVRFGRCELRTARRELYVDGVQRHLQPRPFDLLVYLVENGDRVVTREELLAQVWNDASVQPCSLPAAVLRLRRALGRGHEDAIRTYQRVGYRFAPPTASLWL
jgi:DNA-binding winged helix-turn-helix (wHTH) protein